MWKRRIQANIAEWRKDTSRSNKRRKRTFEFEKKDLDRMERKYRLSDVGNVQVIDMLKKKYQQVLQREDDMKRGSYITIRTNCLERTRNSYTRNLMAVVTFQIKSLMLKKLLNFGTMFGGFLKILTKMLHGSPRSKKA